MKNLGWPNVITCAFKKEEENRRVKLERWNEGRRGRRNLKHRRD